MDFALSFTPLLLLLGVPQHGRPQVLQLVHYVRLAAVTGGEDQRVELHVQLARSERRLEVFVLSARCLHGVRCDVSTCGG